MVSGKLVLIAAAVFGGTAWSVQQFWCGCESNQIRSEAPPTCGEVRQGPALLPLHESRLPERRVQVRASRPRLPLGLSAHGKGSSSKNTRSESKPRPVRRPVEEPPVEIRRPAHPAAIQVFESSY